jgi:hypothetical protein
LFNVNAQPKRRQLKVGDYNWKKRWLSVIIQTLQHSLYAGNTNKSKGKKI